LFGLNVVLISFMLIAHMASPDVQPPFVLEYVLAAGWISMMLACLTLLAVLALFLGRIRSQIALSIPDAPEIVDTSPTDLDRSA
jgi:hypothetical protein